MVQLTVNAASKPVSLARGLPLTIDVTPEATVAEVKRAIVAKYPKVCKVLEAAQTCGMDPTCNTDANLEEMFRFRIGLLTSDFLVCSSNPRANASQ